jgi:hypothetical protein
MKISTKKIKVMGSGILLANIITGVFAGLPGEQDITAEDFYNLPQVTMIGGVNQVEVDLPNTGLSGGVDQETFEITATQFMGGQTEMLGSIPQITMGAGIAGVEYDDFSFSQVVMGSLVTGVNEEFFELTSTLELAGGEDANDRNLGGSDGIIEFTGKIIGEPATANTVPHPQDVDMSASKSLTIGTQTIDISLANTVQDIIDTINSHSPNFPFTVTENPLHELVATYNTDGAGNNGNSINFVLDYIDTNAANQQFSQTLNFDNGENEVLPFAIIDIDGTLPQNSDDNILNVWGTQFNLGNSARSKASIRDEIKGSLETSHADYTFTNEGSSDIRVTATTISQKNNGDLIPLLDAVYFSSNSKLAKLTLTIDEDLVVSADDDTIQFDNVEIDFGQTGLTNVEIIDIIHNKNYLNYDTLKESTDKIIFVAETPGITANGDMPIHDTNFQYSTVNGVQAKAQFTVTQPISTGATDKTITVLGVPVTLGTSGNMVENIATDIMNAVNHPITGNSNYVISTSGTAVVTITKVGVGADSTPIFGADSDYSTVDEVLAQSNPVIPTHGMLDVSVTDRTITINNKVLIIPHGADLTQGTLIDKIIALYNIADTTQYEAFASPSGIYFKQRVGTGMPDSSTLVNEGSYNYQDNLAATLIVDLTTAMLPDNPDESMMNIASTPINLVTSNDYTGQGLTNDQIGTFIQSQSFTGLTSSYDSNNNILTFTTSDMSAAANNFVLGTDLDFTTVNQIKATTSMSIMDEFSGVSQNLLVNIDNQLTIAGVTFDLGNVNLDQEAVADKIISELVNIGTDKFQHGNTNIYTVTKIIDTNNNDAVSINFENDMPGVDNTLLIDNSLTQDKDYTKTKEEKATGSLSITQPIVNGATDKQVQIATEFIDFGQSSETTETMASTIVSDLVGNTMVESMIDSQDSSKILFSSVEIGILGNHDIVTNIDYNGRGQTSTLTFSTLEAGFTYDIMINNVMYNNIVTPTNTNDLFANIVSQLSTDPVVTTTTSGVTVVLESADTIDFTYSVTGASNTAPVATIPTISGNTISGETLTCDYTYSDLESDTQDNTLIEWFSNGQSIQSGSSNMYTLTDSEKNTQVNCEVTVRADYGVTPGMAKMSSEVLIAYDVLELSNNDLFSVPYGVDYVRMNLEAGMTDDSAIFEYIDGTWVNIETDVSDNAVFKPLIGYKYQSNTNLSLPIYIDENYDISEIKRTLDTNFNLVGLNSIYSRSSGEFLSSLYDFNAIYDDIGNMIFDNYNWNNVVLEPKKAYWISVTGVVGQDKIFYGVSDGLNNPNFP